MALHRGAGYPSSLQHGRHDEAALKKWSAKSSLIHPGLLAQATSFKLVSEHFDVLPKPLTGDLPGLLGIEVGIRRCVACLLQPREGVARQPDALLDQSEVLGQPLEPAKKIDTVFTLPIRDERVLRSEVSVCLLIAYRRNRRDEVRERHPRHEGIKPSEAVRHPGSNRPICVPVDLTANLVAIAGHEPIPRVTNERKRKEARKEPPGVAGGHRRRRPLDAVGVAARRPETDAKDLCKSRLDACAGDLRYLNVDSAIRRKQDRVNLVPQGHSSRVITPYLSDRSVELMISQRRVR